MARLSLRLGAGLLTVAAASVASWWAVGDQSEDFVPTPADYVMHPPETSPATERLLGLSASAVLVVLVASLAAATWRRAVDPWWWGVLVPILLVGLFVGWAFRILTAAVVGANIGAGMVMLAGPLVVAGLGALAAGSYARLRPRG